MYDFSRLKGRIKEFYGNQDNFANELEISRQALNFKLNNRIKFSFDELKMMIDKLQIQPEEITDIFFKEKVGKR